VLAQRFEIESATLAAAIQATFKTRRTTLPKLSLLALQADFYELPSKQTQWRAFLRKSRIKADSSLDHFSATWSLAATKASISTRRVVAQKPCKAYEYIPGASCPSFCTYSTYDPG